MVTNREIQIYHQIWKLLPHRYPVEVWVDREPVLIYKSQWEDILARVAEEQYQQYMKEAESNA